MSRPIIPDGGAKPPEDGPRIGTGDRGSRPTTRATGDERLFDYSRNLEEANASHVQECPEFLAPKEGGA